MQSVSLVMFAFAFACVSAQQKARVEVYSEAL